MPAYSQILQQLDSSTQTPRFYNASVDVDPAGSIVITGNYNAAGLIPVLLLSTGIPWTSPACVTHICCLWDISARYRDYDLTQALGATCDENVNLSSRNLMHGNEPKEKSWKIKTMIHPTLVTMLFLSTSPFFIFHETVPIEWNSNAIRWSSAWYGSPCHDVTYTDGRRICIYCANPKPENSFYTFNPNWLETFQCQYTCNNGWVGPNCEVSISATLSLGGGCIGLVCVGWLYILIRSGGRGGGEGKKAIDAKNGLIPITQPKPPPTQSSMPPLSTHPAKSDIITFKDNMLSEIRIKLL